MLYPKLKCRNYFFTGYHHMYPLKNYLRLFLGTSQSKPSQIGELKEISTLPMLSLKVYKKQRKHMKKSKAAS
uniref:Uncharacterized protein n=1 Tax=Cannabis sativa TaxID=3483 RepID=A0A803QTS7_CANSA